MRFFIITLIIYSLGFFIRYVTNESVFRAENTEQCVKEKKIEDLLLLYDVSEKNIYKNNLRINLYLLLGFVCLGVFNLPILFLNGFVFANSIITCYYIGLDISVMFKLFFYHGIIELLTMFFASSVGFKLTYMIYKAVIKNEDFNTSLFFRKLFIAIAIISLTTYLAAYIEYEMIVNLEYDKLYYE